jgi:hypothetical protein
MLKNCYDTVRRGAESQLRCLVGVNSTRRVSLKNKLCTVRTYQPTGCSNCCVHIRLCITYIDDRTTFSYTGDDDFVVQSDDCFCTAAVPDDGPVSAETCSSIVN